MSRLLRIMLLAFGAFLLSPTAVMLHGQHTVAQWEDELRQAVKVLRKDGRIFEGTGREFSPDSLQLHARMGGGEVEFTIQAENIESITFPGSTIKQEINTLISNGDYATASQLLDTLFRQQANYFPYMREDEIEYFTRYVNLALTLEDPTRAIAVAKKMKKNLSDSFVIDHLEDAILLGYYRLNIRDETMKFVGQWLEKAGSYHSSALGWWIKAQLAYREADYEGALWTTLFPISLSSQFPMPFLDKCYVIAIASCHELEYEKKARLLYEEMQARYLDWPEDMPEFERIRIIYAEGLSTENDSEQTLLKGLSGKEDDSAKASVSDPTNKQPNTSKEPEATKPALPRRT